jgi:uncharacterized protein YhjY with autotransporter beta-barrel domain
VVSAGGGQEVLLTIEATSYLTQITSASPDETTIATMLDGARGAHYSDLKPLYDALDPLSGNTLGTALGDLAPNIERTLPLVGEMQAAAFSSILADHLSHLNSGALAGDVPFAVNAQSLMLAGSHVGFDRSGLLAASLRTGLSAGSDPLLAATGADPPSALHIGNGVSGFLTGSSLDGSVESGAGKAQVNGLIVAGGIEDRIGDHFILGVSLAYSDASTALAATPSSAQVDSILGAAYGRYDDDDWFSDAFVGDAAQTMSTRRDVIAGGDAFHLRGHTSGESPTAAIDIGKSLHLEGLRIAPTIGLQWLRTSTEGYSETGGAPAMTFADVTRDSLLGRLGFHADGAFKLGEATVRPVAHGFYVHDFEAGAGAVTAAFAAAPSALLSFRLPSKSRDWGEVGAGFEYDATTNISLGVRYDATIGREDLFYGAWTGHLDIHF